MARSILSLILFLGAALIGFGFLRPAWQEFQNVGRQIQGLQEIGGEFDLLIENRDILANKIKGMSAADARRISSALPEKPPDTEFLVMIENLAQTHGLIIKSVDIAGPFKTAPLISPVTPAAQPRPAPTILPETTIFPAGLTEFPVSLNLIGSYESFKSFLKSLEETLPLTDVTEISFNAPTKAEGPIELNIKLKTYYLS